MLTVWWRQLLRSRSWCSSTNGGIKPEGSAVVLAESILVNDHTEGSLGSGFVMNSDYESTNDGTLTVVATKLVDTSNADLLITVWDLDMAGSLTAGTFGLTVQGWHAAQTIGSNGKRHAYHRR